MTEDLIHPVLWRVDPMNTGCAVNEGMEDEYAALARDIALALRAGAAPREAVLQSFDAAFWPGCLLEDARRSALRAILSELERPEP